MNELLEYEILHAQINHIYTDANAFISVIKLLKFSAPLQGQFISQQSFSRPHKDSVNLLKPLGDMKMDRRQTGQLPDQILETAVGNTFTESLHKNFKGIFFFSSSNTNFSIYHNTSVLSVPFFSWQRSFQGQKKSSSSSDLRRQSMKSAVHGRITEQLSLLRRAVFQCI